MQAIENHMVLGQTYDAYLGEPDPEIVETEEVEYMCTECGELSNLASDDNDANESYIICLTCGHVDHEYRMRYNFFEHARLKAKRQ